MADLTIINCNTQGRIFSGVTDCGNYGTGDFVSAYLTRKGSVVANDSTTFLAGIKTLLQKNELIVLKAYDYRDAHEDNQTTTSSVGNIQLTRLGKPAFEFDITVSVCEMKEISKINNSTQDWDLWLVFENAVICAPASSNSLQGFDLNVVHAESSKLKSGANLQMKTLKCQLRSSTQYNEQMTLIPITDSLADLKSLTGIIDTNITAVIDSTTTLTVTVLDACSKNPVTGLTGSTNWQVLGTQATAKTVSTVAEVGNGVYTLTISSALVDTDTIGVKLATSTTQSVLTDGKYWGGSSALVTYTTP